MGLVKRDFSVFLGQYALVRVNSADELGNKALPFKVGHYCSHFLLKAHLIRVQMDLWATRRFVGVINTGKIFNFSSASFFVETLRVTFLGFCERAVDKYLNKGKV